MPKRGSLDTLACRRGFPAQGTVRREGGSYLAGMGPLGQVEDSPNCPGETADGRRDPAFGSEADFDGRVRYPENVPIVKWPLADQAPIVKAGPIAALKIAYVNGVILAGYNAMASADQRAWKGKVAILRAADHEFVRVDGYHAGFARGGNLERRSHRTCPRQECKNPACVIGYAAGLS